MTLNDTGGTDRAWWADAGDGPPERFEGHEVQSLHVPARDGTRLAIDLYLPKAASPTPVPTFLNSTPYMRGLAFRFPGTQAVMERAMGGGGAWWPSFARYGFASVVMEQRGCGASFGTRVLDPEQQLQDLADVIDWVTSQEWSDGRVVPIGLSAPGLAAQLALATEHPALVAAVPTFTSFDMYTATHPGGLVYGTAVGNVGDMMRGLDTNDIGRIAPSPVAALLIKLLVRGLRPVDGDKSGKLLAEAVQEHRANEYIAVGMQKVDFRDDPLPDTSIDTTLIEQSPCTYAENLVASGAPIAGYAGWWDGASALEMLQLHGSVPNPGSRIVIGPWGHGGSTQALPGAVAKKRASNFDFAADIARFVQRHLEPSVTSPEDPVVYFTMGENRWKSAPAWPPPADRRRLYLAEAGRLADEPAGEDGHDEYRVDPGAGSGPFSRWAIDKHPSRGVLYPDRAARDAKLATYTSEPLPHAVEVTGHPCVGLVVSSSHGDGAFLVYLEEVTETGEVGYVTEGGLRAANRATGQPAEYEMLPGRVARTFGRADAQPLVAGEPTELVFDLLPISYRFSPGSSIRVAIAGADADHFKPLAGAPAPVISLHRGPTGGSWVELPVVASAR